MESQIGQNSPNPATGSIPNRACGNSLKTPDWPLAIKFHRGGSEENLMERRVEDPKRCP
jgi:hypothetical protein